MAWIRRGIIAVLGLVLLMDAFVASPFPVLQFVIALIMLGLVPVDAIVDALSRPAADDETVERLREVMAEKDRPPAG